MFAVVTKVEVLAVKATAVSVPVQFLDLLQTFSAATAPASIQCVLVLLESTLCCTSAATALASADHNPARFRDSSISSAISKQHKSIRPNSNDAHSIYSICSHDKASVLVLQSCATVSSHQRHRCSAYLCVHIVTMLILSKFVYLVEHQTTLEVLLWLPYLLWYPRSIADLHSPASATSAPVSVTVSVVQTTASRRNQASVAAPVIVTKVATPAISAAEALQSFDLSRISSAATAPGTLQCHPTSVTVSAVVTNVGAATALASVTVSFIVAHQKSSCYLCSCNSSSLRSIADLTASTAPAFVAMQFDLSQAPRAIHTQSCCSACYRYQCSTPLLLLQVVDWLGWYQWFVHLHS